MIRVILPAIILLATSLSSSAAINVDKNNGGTHGYKTIRESHSGNNHHLDCANPGNEKCTWTISPALVSNYAEIDMYVTDQLASGYLSGSWNTVDDNNAPIVVTWNGTGTTNVSIQIQ